MLINNLLKIIFDKKKNNKLIPKSNLGEPEKFPDLEKLILYKGRYFLTKILGVLLSLILLIVLGSGVFKNDWIPWQQMQVFVLTTLSLLFGYYFGKR